jgi:hypothetical protein
MFPGVGGPPGLAGPEGIMDRHRSTLTLGRLAVLAAAAGTVLAPLHALSRFATVDGAKDLQNPLVRSWAEPAARALRPLLDWAGPDTVYLTYGKVFDPVVLVATVCAFAVRRSRSPRGLERWGWWVALTGYVVLTTGVLGEYWTPWVDGFFMALAAPGVLLSLIGSSLLGIGLLRRGFRPRAAAWLLATWLLTGIALGATIYMGAVLVPMLWAWTLAVREGREPRDVPTAHERQREVARRR